MNEATEALSPQAETLESGKGLDAILSKNLEGFGEEAKPADTPTEIEPPKTDGAKIDKTGRAHGADGKFAPKNSTEAKAPQGTADAPVTTEVVPPADPALTAQSVQPPAKWADSEKAEFAKLPRPIQEWLVKRDGETEATFTRKTQELADTRKAIEPLLNEAQQLTPVFQRFGMTPHQFLRESAVVADKISSGAPDQQGQAIAYLMQLHNVRPESVLTALGIPIPTGGEGFKQPDPALSQLHQQVSGLTKQLQQMGEQRQLEERQRAQAEFDALGQSKDQNGQLKYPHFQRVSRTMLQLVANGMANTWEDAYAKSVRSDDELFKQTVDAERQRVAEETEKQRLDAIEKAKKAAPVKSSDGSPKGGAQFKGIDAHLNAALDRAGIGA